MMFKIYLAINTVFWLVMAVFANIVTELKFMERVYRIIFFCMFAYSAYLLIQNL